ncbi:hypothetical protein J6V86_01170 [bacterium]|nr:hypothetical protein [bacterium]
MAKVCCKSKQSKDVIFFVFSIISFHIFMFAVLMATVGATLSFNILCNRFTTVVFQLVPVTQITKKSLDGWLYSSSANFARSLLYV